MDYKQLVKKIAYFILYSLMDIENLLWNIADIIIYPVARLRKWVIYRISKLPQ